MAKNKCEDKKCPTHGNLKIGKRLIRGVVTKKDTHRTATIEWTYRLFVSKYERYQTYRTKVHAHNPTCIDAKVGEAVMIAQTRPLSKTKNFVIVKVLGKEKGFAEEMEAREEAKAVIEKKERKKPEEKAEEENASS